MPANAGIHVFLAPGKDVDGRDGPGHDGQNRRTLPSSCPRMRASTSFLHVAKTWMAGTGPAMTVKAPSRHLDLAVFRRHRAVVVEPGEAEGAAFGDPCRELEVGVGRDRGLEVDAEHRLAVERAGEPVDDLTRDELATLVLAK